MSALNALREAGSDRTLLFAHAAQSPTEQLFSAELQQARAKLPGLCTLLFHEREASAGIQTGRMQLSAATLADFNQAHFYLCGPQAFMREQWRALLSHGISPLQIDREVFGPDLLEHLR